MTAQDSFPSAQAEVPSGGNCNDERVQVNANTLLQAHCFISRVSPLWRLRRSLLHLDMDPDVRRASWANKAVQVDATTMFVLAITVSG